MKYQFPKEKSDRQKKRKSLEPIRNQKKVNADLLKRLKNDRNVRRSRN